MNKKKVLISLGTIISICVVILVALSLNKEKVNVSKNDPIIDYSNIPVMTKEDYKEKYRDVVTLGCNAYYDYSKLTKIANVIALVEVLDNLTPENSKGLIDFTVSNEVYDWVGIRQVKVLQYFKDERNYGDVITINEGAAIDKEGNFIHAEGYDPLIKGEKYLVFLSDDCFTEQLGTMAEHNSVIHVDEFNENDQFYDIAVKSVIDLLSDLPDKEKKEIVNADIEKSDTEINETAADEIVNIKIGNEEKEIKIKKGNNGKLKVDVKEKSNNKNNSNKNENSQTNQNQNSQGQNQNSQGNKNQNQQ